ncbi:MAG: ATP-binding protein [candidate division WOR-3 bacterium]|nr:ATP-binding protein [candidate division WOR-3 bacterium]
MVKKEIRAQEDLLVALEKFKKLNSSLKDSYSSERKIKGEKVYFFVNDVVKDVLKFSKQLLSKKISISAKNPKSNKVLLANKNLLYQVLLNLIIMAKEAIEEDGEISIEVGEVFCPKRGSKGRKFSSISVSDTGCGMNVVRKRIFDPIFTAKNSSGSSVFGLHFILNSIKNMGGWVEILSEPDHGSTFIIYLPLFD